MKTITVITQVFFIYLLYAVSTISAQQTEIIYNSDTGGNGPQLLLEEAGDSGSVSGQDGWARMWFRNSTDATNRWGFLARPQVGAMDNEGKLTSPLVMAYTGVQKFGFGSDGTLRINKQYSFPNMDGNNGEVLMTDGTGNVGWGAAGGGSSSLWTESGSNVYRATGKIGIGTSIPTAELSIDGTSAVSIDLKSPSSKQINFRTGAPISSLIVDNGNAFRIVKSLGTSNLELSSNNGIVVVSENVIAMSIDAGNVDIPGRLEVAGKIEIGDDSTPATPGAMRFAGGVFEGYSATLGWMPLSSPKSVTHVIDAGDLNPGDDADYLRNIGAYTYFTNLATNPNLRYSLPVPVGGTIQRVRFVALDNTTSESIRMIVYKNGTAVGGNVVNTQVGDINSYDTPTNEYQNYILVIPGGVTVTSDDVVYVNIYATDSSNNPITWPGNDLRITKLIVEYDVP